MKIQTLRGKKLNEKVVSEKVILPEQAQNFECRDRRKHVFLIEFCYSEFFFQKWNFLCRLEKVTGVFSDHPTIKIK